jgi:hypothetical protein
MWSFGILMLVLLVLSWRKYVKELKVLKGDTAEMWEQPKWYTIGLITGGIITGIYAIAFWVMYMP